MANQIVFSPGNNAALPVTGTAASLTLPVGSGTALRVGNDGTATIFIAIGTAAAAATATATAAGTGSTFILPGATEVFTIDRNVTTISAICTSAGSSTLRVTRGQGW